MHTHDVTMLHCTSTLARLAFPSCGRAELLARVDRFTDVLDELSYYRKDIQRVLSFCLDDKEVPREIAMTLPPIAFAASSANALWLAGYSTDAPESLLLLVASLSHCPVDLSLEGGVNAGITSVAGISLRDGRRDILDLMTECSYGWIMRYPWFRFAPTSLLRAVICAFRNRDCDIVAMYRRKLTREPEKPIPGGTLRAQIPSQLEMFRSDLHPPRRKVAAFERILRTVGREAIEAARRIEEESG